METRDAAGVASQLLENLNARCAALEQYAERLRAQRGSALAAGPRDLLDFITNGVGRVAEKLEALAAQYDSQLPGLANRFPRLERRAKRLGQVISLFHFMLGYVVHSDVTLVPECMARPLEAMAQRWFPKSQIVLQSVWELNYLYEPAGALVERVARWLGSAGSRSYLAGIMFPACLREDMLAHCILGHELGHYVDEILKVSANVRNVAPRDLFRESQSWIAEMAADCFGLYTMGPAYFFAFAEFGLSDVLLDEPDDEHPPPRQRLGALLELLKSNQPFGVSYYEALGEAGRSAVDRWGSFLDATRHDAPLVYPYQELMACVDAAQPDLVLNIQARARKVGYAPSRLQEMVARLTEDICRLVPPSEVLAVGASPQEGQEEPELTPTVTQADAVTILNAAWVAYLGRKSDLEALVGACDATPERSVRAILNRLVAKALDSITVVAAWEEAMSTCSAQLRCSSASSANSRGVTPRA